MRVCVQLPTHAQLSLIHAHFYHTQYLIPIHTHTSFLHTRTSFHLRIPQPPLRTSIRTHTHTHTHTHLTPTHAHLTPTHTPHSLAHTSLPPHISLPHTHLTLPHTHTSLPHTHTSLPHTHTSLPHTHSAPGTHPPRCTAPSPDTDRCTQRRRTRENPARTLQSIQARGGTTLHSRLLRVGARHFTSTETRLCFCSSIYGYSSHEA